VIQERDMRFTYGASNAQRYTSYSIQTLPEESRFSERKEDEEWGFVSPFS